MTVWGALAGGFLGTLVLTTGLRTANELGLIRIDLPFLLGTALTGDRARAKAVGYLLHLMAGELSALVYYAIFAAIDTSGWLLGALLGLLHGIVSATALVHILLPVVHPRMGSALSAAHSSPLLEPPGFLLRNYGHGTNRDAGRAHRLRRHRRRPDLDRRLTTRQPPVRQERSHLLETLPASRRWSRTRFRPAARLPCAATTALMLRLRGRRQPPRWRRGRPGQLVARAESPARSRAGAYWLCR